MNRFSLIFDISGQVTKESTFDSYFTVGGAIIPFSNEQIVRDLLEQNMPKWKNATTQSLSIVAKAIKENNIYCTVVIVVKSKPEWDTFWTNGKDQYNNLANKLKTKIGFAKSGNVIRNLSIAKCSMIGLGALINSKDKPTILDQNGYVILNLKIICDTDIQGGENQEVFKTSWARWCKNTKVQTALNIKPYLESIDFMTEQDDPLILLPDYLAGCIHCKASGGITNLPDNLKYTEIKEFVKLIESSNRMFIESFQFDEIYPDLTPL